MTDRACGPIIPVEITVVIDDVDDQIAAGYDQIQVHRSTNGEAGVYVELTIATTRIDLVAGEPTYYYEDPEGNANYWYKFRLYKSATQDDGTFSDPQPGEVDPAFDIVSIEELKTNFLFGLDLTDDTGKPYPDSLYASFIRGAVSSLERRLDVTLRRTVISEERHDFYADDFDKYVFLKTFKVPVISIESVRMVLPGDGTGNTFSKDWLHLQRHSGQIQLVPGPGASGITMLGRNSLWWPLFHGGAKFVPDVFRIAYTAGFGYPPAGSYGFAAGSEPASVSYPDPDNDRIPDDVKEIVGKIASFGPLNIAGDLLGGAGIASQSIGLDGLSQSFNTTSSATSAGFGARLITYNREIKAQLPILEKYFRGLRMFSV